MANHILEHVRMCQKLWEELREEYPFLWKWEWKVNGRFRTRYGSCNYTRKRIDIAQWLMESDDTAQVKDTFLHEIAHAITGPGSGHGNDWKAVCRVIGANPVRCGSREVVAKHSTFNRRRHVYDVVCPNCGKIGTRKRKRRNGMKYIHKRCGEYVTFRKRRIG